MEEEISYNDIKDYKFTREEVIQIGYSKRKKLLFFVLVAMVIAVFIILITPREYESSVIIVPQIGASPGVNKKYSKIAAMAGIKLKTNENLSLLPTLYPIIVSSTPFRKEILQTPLKLNGKKDVVPLSDYLAQRKKPFIDKVENYTLGLPGLIINSFISKPAAVKYEIADSTLQWLTPREISQFSFLDDAINIKYNDIDGYVEVIGKMPEAIASAQLTKAVHELLQNYIINYNIEKSKDELLYLEGRLEEAENNFFMKRATYGEYLDRNKDIVSSYSQNRANQYKNEYELVYSLYSELSSELENTKLQVKKDTPVFTIIKPVTVPLQPLSRGGLIIMGLFTFIGATVGLIWIFFRYSMLFLRNYFSS